MDSTPSRAARNRLSCSECQRRKQKRKVADKCRFALPAAKAPAEASTALDSRKRQASPDEAHKNVISSDFPPGSLGYSTADLLAGLGLEDKACFRSSYSAATETDNQARKMRRMTSSTGQTLRHVLRWRVP
ncbi:hypothetical protein BM221_007164 [Beauveria bassiana]|uniref:Uncharacterized protein n=1 Tax=Beauveria bassiana TaxID=176275 RepID=A0A2N6NJU8_BEABA|nr:hypothetical protein BM221_007164 [Beauveria bassiana]